jgi:hypothetical protein
LWNLYSLLIFPHIFRLLVNPRFQNGTRLYSILKQISRVHYFISGSILILLVSILLTKTVEAFSSFRNRFKSPWLQYYNNKIVTLLIFSVFNLYWYLFDVWVKVISKRMNSSSSKHEFGFINTSQTVGCSKLRYNLWE